MNKFNQYYKQILNEEEDIDLKSMFPPASEDELIDRMTLHKAIDMNMPIDVIKKMINKSADINEKDKYGYTPLHIACCNNRYNIAKLLIDNGADVNVKNIYTNTPLLAACVKNNTKVAELLIDNGADVNAMNEYSVTPLSLAHRYDNKELIDLLIKHGAKE